MDGTWERSQHIELVHAMAKHYAKEAAEYASLMQLATENPTSLEEYLDCLEEFSCNFDAVNQLLPELTLHGVDISTLERVINKARNMYIEATLKFVPVSVNKSFHIRIDPNSKPFPGSSGPYLP